MKSSCRPVVRIASVLLFSFLFSLASNAQQTVNTIDPKTYAGMKWRLIGPFRGGRVLAVTGVSSQPNTYYFGAVAGGVWKTTDGGVTWDPCSDLSGPRVEIRKWRRADFRVLRSLKIQRACTFNTGSWNQK